MITAKELKQLAKACRLSGIKHFKCAEFEFTLDERYHQVIRKMKAPTDEQQEAMQPTGDVVQDKIATDSMSEEDLLFWSSAV